MTTDVNDQSTDTFYNKLEQNIEMKMMDTIIFDGHPSKKNQFKPIRWIFTDLMGNLHFKDINTISLKDVIKAFFVNLSMGKNKYEYNNEDLMTFIANNKLEKIVVAIIQ